MMGDWDHAEFEDMRSHIDDLTKEVAELRDGNEYILVRELREQVEDLAQQLEALTEYFEASEELSKFIALSEKDRRHEGRFFKSQARLKKARKAIAALQERNNAPD